MDKEATEMAKIKLNRVVELEDNPSVRGMINKVHHLVTVID